MNSIAPLTPVLSRAKLLVTQQSEVALLKLLGTKRLASKSMEIQRELGLLVRLSRLTLTESRVQYFAYSLIEARRTILEWKEEVERLFPMEAQAAKADSELRDRLRSVKSSRDLQSAARPRPPAGTERRTALIKYEISKVLATDQLLDESISWFNNHIQVDQKKQPFETLRRTITFEPEYKQAGISILAYFSEVVHAKYPDLNVRVRIEQEGNHITLEIESPDGTLERIERELTQYGLVVVGQMAVEDFMPDAVGSMRLRQKLELAQMELRHTKELLHVDRTHFNARLTSFETEIAFVRKLLDKNQYELEQTVQTLRQLASAAGPSSVDSINRIIDALSAKSDANQEMLRSELAALKTDNPTLLDRLNELFVKGSIQGASGNYLYAALQALQRMM